MARHYPLNPGVEPPVAVRHAAFSLWVLGGLYAFHGAYVCHIGPANERAAESFWLYPVIVGAVLVVVTWTGSVVRQGGRLIGAVVVALVLLGCGAIGGVFAAKSKEIRTDHAPFVILEVAIVLWALVTLILLERARHDRKHLRL